VAHQEQGPTSATAVQEHPSPIRDASSNQVAANSFSESQIGSTIANKVILPVVRVLYIIEHRKQLFIRDQVQKLQAGLCFMVKSVAKTLIQQIRQGPIKTTKAVLEIGGGKRNVALTFTVAYTVILLLRPMLRVVFTESPVGP
jgi:hypothetical protein